jgi:hypothetical protein
VWAILLLVLIVPTWAGCSLSQNRTGPEVQLISAYTLSVYYPDQGKFFLYTYTEVSGECELKEVFTIPAIPGGRLIREKSR